MGDETREQAKWEIIIGLSTIFAPLILSFWARRTIVIAVPLLYWGLLVGLALCSIIHGSYRLIASAAESSKHSSRKSPPKSPTALEELKIKFDAGEIPYSVFRQKKQSCLIAQARSLNAQIGKEKKILLYEEKKLEEKRLLNEKITDDTYIQVYKDKVAYLKSELERVHRELNANQEK